MSHNKSVKKLHYYKDLKDKKYGKLLVEEYLYTNKRRKAVWKCKCDCGNYIEVSSDKLTTGNTKSCGCLHKETSSNNIKKAIKKNIKYKSKAEEIIIKTFKRMEKRCYDFNCQAYKNYGGRGIKVCDEWLNNNNLFYIWSINNGWRKGLTIDRIDVNGNYEPNNCRWVSNLIQQNNKRNNKYLTFNNETHTIAEWSRILNIPKGTISDRIRRNYPIEKILNNKYTRRDI